MTSTVCLNMIVKNEAPVIRRCLDSVRPIISTWVIVDTGSTDGTQNVIRDHMRDMPGQLFERPWRDFAHNRTEALELARGKADYSFIIDADDTLQISEKFVMPPLTSDSYSVEIEHPPMRYWRTQLVRGALPWKFRGVLHEFLECKEAKTTGTVPGVSIRFRHDGARSKDPETYRRDAAVLEKALRTETDPFMVARYRFYLAQSYRDCGETLKAIENYLERAKHGFWQEEVFVSLYQAAKLKEQAGFAADDVLHSYSRASEAAPTRAEALYAASRFCRFQKKFDEGYRIAKRGLALNCPSEALFVEPWIYQYGLLDEYGTNAYWSGRYRECLDSCLLLLASGRAPKEHRVRIAENANFALCRLSDQGG